MTVCYEHTSQTHIRASLQVPGLEMWSLPLENCMVEISHLLIEHPILKGQNQKHVAVLRHGALVHTLLTFV